MRLSDLYQDRFAWLKGNKDIDFCDNCWIDFVKIVNDFLQDKDGNWLVRIPWDKKIRTQGEYYEK